MISINDVPRFDFPVALVAHAYEEIASDKANWQYTSQTSKIEPSSNSGQKRKDNKIKNNHFMPK